VIFAHLDLVGQGSPIPGRPALYNVGDENLGAFEPAMLFDNLVQKLSRSSHEGLALLILPGSRSLPHDDELGIAISVPRNRVLSGLAKLAATASGDR